MEGRLDKTILERRAAARKAEKEKREAELVAPPEAPLDDGGPRMRDLRTDKRFLAMLAAEAQTDPEVMGFIARLANNTPSAEDGPRAVQWRKEYMDRTARVQALTEKLDSNMDRLRRFSPGMNDICNTHGTDIFTKSLKEGLVEIAFRDIAKFEALEAGFDMVDAAEAAIPKAEAAISDPEHYFNRTISDFQKKYRVTDEEFDAIQKEKDSMRRASRYQDIIRQQMGFFERWADRRRESRREPSSLAQAQMMARADFEANKILDEHEAKLKRLEAERDELIKKCGGLIASLASDNDEMRMALARASAGETALYPKGTESHITLQDAKAEMQDDKLKASELHREFKSYLEETKQAEDYFDAGAAEDERDAIEQKFWAHRSEERVGRRKGFVARLIEWWLKDKFKDPRIKSALRHGV